MTAPDLPPSPPLGSDASSNHRTGLLWLAVLLAAAVAWLGPAVRSASAAPTGYLYWTDVNGYADADPATVGYIGRAGIDGSDVRPTFARPWTTDDYRGIAARGSYLYVTNERQYKTADGSSNREATIGRLKLDGTGFEDRYVVPRPDSNQPYMDQVIVTDSGLYWSGGFYDYGAPLGRANLDGTGIDADFAHIGAYDGYNSDQSANSSTLFFAHRYFTGDGLQSDLARVALDGGGAQLDFIPNLHVSSTAATDEYVYWVDALTQAIGRARTDGSQVDRTFIPDAAPDTGGRSGTALATDGTHLYWNVGDRIDRSDVDGTHITRGFIHTGRQGVVALTTGQGADPSTDPPSSPDEPSAPTGPAQVPPGTLTPTDPPQSPERPAGAPVPTPAPPLERKPTASVKVRASLTASRVGRRRQLTVRVTNAPAGAKLAVTWQPERGRATRQTVTVRRSVARAKAPAKAGRYRVTVRYRGKTLLRNRTVLVR